MYNKLYVTAAGTYLHIVTVKAIAITGEVCCVLALPGTSLAPLTFRKPRFASLTLSSSKIPVHVYLYLEMYLFM